MYTAVLKKTRTSSKWVIPIIDFVLSYLLCQRQS